MDPEQTTHELEVQEPSPERKRQLRNLSKYRSLCGESFQLNRAYRTTARTSTNLSSLAMVYRSAAVLPTEGNAESVRGGNVNSNNQVLTFDRDTLDETKEVAVERVRRYQKTMAKQYNKKVQV